MGEVQRLDRLRHTMSHRAVHALDKFGLYYVAGFSANYTDKELEMKLEIELDEYEEIHE